MALKVEEGTKATRDGRAACLSPQEGAPGKRARLWGPSGAAPEPPRPQGGPSQAAAGDEGRFRDLVRTALVKPRDERGPGPGPRSCDGAEAGASGRRGSGGGGEGLDRRGSGGGAGARSGYRGPRQGSPPRSRAHMAQPLGVTPYALLPPPRARQSGA